MTIPGRGDLSPRRRYRHGRRRWPRVLVFLLVLAVLGAGAWYGYHRWHDDGDTSTLRTAPTPCPTGTPSGVATGPRPHAVPVRVLNGTLRTGLAHQVASSLHRHAQLPIGKVGNAPRMVKGPSVVRYPERMAWEARLVASRLSPPATLAAQAGAATVELDLGTAFRRLATEQEATAEYRQLTAAATASPAPTPSAHSCSRS